MFVQRGPAIVLGLVLGAAAPVLATSVAWAGDGGAVKDVDPCSADAKVKLKVVDQGDQGLETTGVVWSDDEDVWDWKFKHNGDSSFDGSVKAKDADKSFKIVRIMVNFPGPDSVAFRAENRRTGETCRAEVNF
jgi:hypothetical protein